MNRVVCITTKPRFALLAFLPENEVFLGASSAFNSLFGRHREVSVKVLLLFVAWCILLAVSWPLALVVLVLLPVVWLVALPFRLFGIAISASFSLVSALLFLPARILGHRR